MEKYVLGLDLGVSSVGYALIKENQENDTASIVKMGVRIVSSDPDFHGNFAKGQAASKNASRRDKRQIRRGYQRYQLRRNQLLNILEEQNMTPGFALRYEKSKEELLALRANAVTEKLSLEELGRVFMLLLRKRGFKSNRKANAEEDNKTAYKMQLSEWETALEGRTIGQYFWDEIQKDSNFSTKGFVFYRNTYLEEFNRIWKNQQQYYPELLTGDPDNPEPGNLYFDLGVRTLFYQRRLKSQKHLIGKCRFEGRKPAAHKFSPYFQLYRIWQQINDLRITDLEGKSRGLTDEERGMLFLELNDPEGKHINKAGQLAASKILKMLGLDKHHQLNFPDGLEGNKLKIRVLKVLKDAGIKEAEKLLAFDWTKPDMPGPLFLLWHMLYSIEQEKELVKALPKQLKEQYGIEIQEEQAKIIASKLAFTADYGNVSVRAIRKLMPYLEEGLSVYHAAEKAGYKDEEVEAQSDRLENIAPNSLKNPVVEQLLNQMVSVVNDLIERTGIKPNQIRVEMARELKSNARRREEMTKRMGDAKKAADIARKEIEKEGKRASSRDVLRYRLWEECDKKCLYSGKPIPYGDLFNGATEIEHVIPKSRMFNNTRANLILVYKKENEIKGQQTAADYMQGKGEAAYQTYVESVESLFQKKMISKGKREFLLMTEEHIPEDFVEHQLRNTQYIARAAMNHLATLVGEKNVWGSTGQITDYLREQWGLVDVLKELNLPLYKEAGLTVRKTIKKHDGTEQEVDWIPDFSKRSDHRHHAVDALLTALTNHKIVHYLNNLNKFYSNQAELRAAGKVEAPPIPNLRQEVKRHLEGILVSFKKPKAKAISPKYIRRYPKKARKEDKVLSLVPRGELHKETIFGKIKEYEKVPLNKKFDRLNDVVDHEIREYLAAKLAAADGKPEKAFKHSILYQGNILSEVVCWKEVFTKRVAIENLKAPQIWKNGKSKILDGKIRDLIVQRFKEQGEKDKNFQQSVKETPILWNGKAIQRVTVRDEGNLIPVREGHAYAKNNHHAIIYTDGKGNFEEEIWTLEQVVKRSISQFKETGELPKPIQPNPKPGWKLWMTLQINDMFLIDVDSELLKEEGWERKPGLSKHLYRLQNLSSSYYVFRHCYQTALNLEVDFAMKRLRSANAFDRVFKVRLSPSGTIILDQ